MNAMRLARFERGQTLEEVASATGVDQSHLSKLERGLHQPSAATAKRIADYYGVSVAQLLGVAPDREAA